MATNDRARGVVGLGLVVGLLAACGGSTPGSAPGTTASTTTAPSTSTSPATDGTGLRLEPGSQRVSLEVGGTTRTATVVVPEDASTPAPLVFVFHGHGGTGAHIQRKLAIEAAWPEAVVVYPDGLVGHVGKTDPQGVKTGWQTVPGEADDRDLALFDALLAGVQGEVPIDPGRIYVMGHSNGSQMASLALHERGEEVAAAANLSATPNALLPTDPVRSMFFAMGTDDPIVPIAHQRAAIPLAEKRLGIDPATTTSDGDLTTGHAPAPGDIELQVLVYGGGHEPPVGITPLVVDFLKRQSLPPD